jgi:hypothetical protein
MSVAQLLRTTVRSRDPRRPCSMLPGEDVWVLTDEELQQLAGRLVEVPGVTAVMLGGSRVYFDEHGGFGGSW